jgi:hypothetical protein
MSDEQTAGSSSSSPPLAHLEKRGIDLAQAAVDGVMTFVGGTGAAVAGAWLNSKLNPPAPPPAGLAPQPIVELPPGVDRE